MLWKGAQPGNNHDIMMEDLLGTSEVTQSRFLSSHSSPVKQVVLSVPILQMMRQSFAAGLTASERQNKVDLGP